MITDAQRDTAERIALADAYDKLGTIARRVARDDEPVALTSHGTDLVFLVSANYRPRLGVGESGGPRASSGGRRDGSVCCQTCRATAELIGTPDDLADTLAQWIKVHTAPDHIQTTAGDPVTPEGTHPA